MAQAARDQAAEAVEDEIRDLQFNPALAASALNRGIIHDRRGSLDKANADLTNALRKTSNPSELILIR